jgi:hypothetical protein
MRMIEKEPQSNQDGENIKTGGPSIIQYRRHDNDSQPNALERYSTLEN